MSRRLREEDEEVEKLSVHDRQRYGTVLNLDINEYENRTKEEDQQIKYHEKELLTKGTRNFLSLLSSGSFSRRPDVKLSVDLKSDKKGDLIREIPFHGILNVETFGIRLPEHPRDKIYNNLKNATFQNFINENCYIYTNVNMYIYVNPLIMKYLIDFDKNEIYNFIPFIPQNVLDTRLIDHSSSVGRASSNRVKELNDNLEILKKIYRDEDKNLRNRLEEVNDRIYELKKDLIEAKDQLRSRERSRSSHINYSAVIREIELEIEGIEEEISYYKEEEYRVGRQISNIRIKIVKDEEQILKEIDEIKKSVTIDYDKPYSIIFPVGEIPLCDKMDRPYDRIYYLHIFTDGSLDGRNNQASSAYIPLFNKVAAGRIDNKISPGDTFRCELFAILLGLKLFDKYVNKRILSNIFSGKEDEKSYLIPRIFTDNMFCVIIIKKCMKYSISQVMEYGRKVGREILSCNTHDLSRTTIGLDGEEKLAKNYKRYLEDNVDLLNEIVQYNFSLEHIKSHSGNFGNSVADMFANYARTRGIMNNFSIYDLNY